MRHFVTIVTFFISTYCYSQKSIYPIDKWKSYSITSNDDTLSKYNHDTKDWTVFLKGTKVFATVSRKKISDTLPFKIIPTENDKYKIGGSRSVIQVDDGFLVGFYRGEWGGNLYWFSKDGKQKYEISNHEIVQFIKRDNKIYAIEGLDHGSISEGSIIEVNKLDEKWRAIDYLKLPSAPAGIDLDINNRFIIITSNSLLTIDTNS